MRRSALAVVCGLLVVASAACKKDQQTQQPEQPADMAATEPAPADSPGMTTPAGTGTAATATPRPVPPPPLPSAVRDVPYISNDTGTVAPGMTEADVIAMWGRPAAVSRMGAMTYLYFPNGCERSCGTLDVVLFESGQVVDAVLRWPGHGYSGQSSSPPGTQPMATIPQQPLP